MFRLSDPLHCPSAQVSKARTVVDGDYDGLVWATLYTVTISGVGSVGSWKTEAQAQAIARAYRDPNATRRSVLEARAQLGCDWSREQLTTTPA